MATFMKIEGIEGESTAKGYEKWIDIDHALLGTNRGLNPPFAGSTDSHSKVTDVTVTKKVDKASPSMFQDSVASKQRTVQIHFTIQGSDGPETYLEIRLHKAVISSYELGPPVDAGRPGETIYFYFSKIEMIYTPYDDDRNPEAPVPAGYEVTTAGKH